MITDVETCAIVSRTISWTIRLKSQKYLVSNLYLEFKDLVDTPPLGHGSIWEISDLREKMMGDLELKGKTRVFSELKDLSSEWL